MTETVEREKANDPKALRMRIAELEKELSKKPAPAPKPERSPKLEDYEVIVDGRDLKAIVDAATELEERFAAFDGHFADLRSSVNGANATIRRARQTGPAALAKRLAKAPPILPTSAHAAPTIPPKASKPNGNPAPHSSQNAEVGRGGLRRILIALAQRTGLTNRQLGVRAGLSSQSGTFSTYLGKARAMGWIRDEGDARHITQAGFEALGGYEPLPEGRALLEHWLGELGSGGASRILRALADAYPRSMSNEEIGKAAGISSQSGTFSTYMGRLRTLELVAGGRGAMHLSEELVG